MMQAPFKKNLRRLRPNRAKDRSQKALPRIFICGDPHGEFEYINHACLEHRPDAVIILGDMQPERPLEEILAPALSVTEVWWIPGNHDSDTDGIVENLWNSRLGEHNLHGRVANICGLRVAGLGGVFRGQIWMPDGAPHYRTPDEFVKRMGPEGGALPRRHRTSIFPQDYDALTRLKADILVTHEACGCHKKGFAAIDRLMRNLKIRWFFHGHQHEDWVYGKYRGVTCRGVGFRGIVDLEGNDIVKAQIDPRDLLFLQSAGEEPDPEVFDTIYCSPVVDFAKCRKPVMNEHRGYQGRRILHSNRPRRKEPQVP